ncbi:MAG: TIR domain-containing protein [Cyanobacteria bacterium P01_F01_bin.143]
MTKVTEGTIITFYSYKGGVGRTLALANVGALLSRWGYRVLCIDWDLEAPGLHLYFQKWMSSSSFSEQQGLAELIQAYINGEKIDWQSFVTQIELPNSQHPLFLMIAGSQNNSYIERMQTLQWDELYETKQLGNFLETLRNEWKAEFDFILIDSRTGVTDSGGICTVQMPDYLCLLFTANKQSLYGAVNIVHRARQTRNHLPFDRGKLWVLPVATRFEARIEYELAQEWLSTFDKVLSPLYEEWINKDISPSSLLNFIKVPYVPYWSFGEKIPVLEEETKDTENIGFSFETITAILASKFARSDLLIKNRYAYINSAIKSQDLIPYAWGEIFISYSWEEESRKIADKLDQAFQARGITIIRDIRDLGYKDSIKEFITSMGIGRRKCVIVIISKKYLQSENCMFELLQISRNEQFYDRIFPIVLDDAKIYRTVDRIKYIQFWETKILELDEAMKTVSSANLLGFREEIDIYSEIKNYLPQLSNILKDMNTVSAKIDTELGIEELTRIIEHKLAE